MDEYRKLYFDKLVSLNKEDEIISVAHSFGCLVALNLVQSLPIIVSKMVLVACPKNKMEGHNLKSLLEKISDREKQIIAEFVEQDYDWNKIKAKVERLIFMYSDNDHAIQYDETLSYYQEIFPEAEFRIYQNYGHFNHKSNVFEMPDILRIIQTI